MSKTNDIIIKDTHRGLWYEDGVLVKILEAGRYKPPRLNFIQRRLPEAWRRKMPKIEVALVDIRERDRSTCTPKRLRDQIRDENPKPGAALN